MNAKTAASDATVLRTQDLTKAFPGVVALDGLNFDLRRGEIHALVGENGAGKSTFINLLAGVYQPTRGEIRLGGRKVVFRNPRESQAAGIAVIHQERNLVPFLRAVDNIFLGVEESRGGVVREALHEERAKALLARFGIELPLRTPVSQLKVAEQQMVEILKALYLEPSILLLDEPTSSLSDHEVEALFRTLQRLREQGVAIIYISHRMDEVFRIADRISVLRNGRKMATRECREVSRDQVISLMIDRDLKQQYPKEEVALGGIVLAVEDLGDAEGHFRAASLKVRAGEIVGLAGMVGAGRTELAEALFGARPRRTGRVMVDGREVRPRSVRDAIRAGICLVPEDRRGEGLVTTLRVRENLTLAHLLSFAAGGWVQSRRETEAASRIVEELQIKTQGPEQQVLFLSGGNQQKVVLGKWLLSDSARVFIFDEPTNGVDVGAKREIYRLLVDLAKQGKAILLISSDLQELTALSDRIYVLREGEIKAEFDRQGIVMEDILKVALGGGLTREA